MAARAKPATIREVAALAGVSTATVSRTLRNSANVDPATRQRVEEAARTLRYRPSNVARSLKLRSTRTIGLIVTDIENPYFPQIISAVEDAAREREHSVLLADGRRDAERELASLELLAEREVDGLIIASSTLTARHSERIAELPCPVVIVNNESTVPAVPAIVSDNLSGGRLAAEHLSDLGHRQVVYVAAPHDSNHAATDRFEGAAARFEELGSPWSLEAVQAEAGVEGGYRAAQRALEEYPATTALLCYNDLTAVGGIRGLRAIGRSVPADVSVMGFDDIEIAPYVDPALTTVRQATTKMGRLAVDKLFEQLADGTEAESEAADDAPGETRRLPVELVIRDSTTAVRA